MTGRACVGAVGGAVRPERQWGGQASQGACGPGT